MATINLEEPVYRANRGPVFFAAGFRPFFLFAALHAASMLPLWLAVWSGAVDLHLPYSPILWHSHEMVFGFAGAAVGGFLLTAVPNWTNGRTLSGLPLMLLFGLWLAGRVAFTLAGFLPPAVVAVADLSYLPVLGGLVGHQLIRANNRRNMIFLLILAAYWLANLAVHLGLAGIGDPLAGIHAGIVVVLAMIAVVGGRIVPSFTQTWLAMTGQPAEPRKIAWIERGGAPLSVVVAGGLWVLAPDAPVTGAALLAAAAIHSVRLAGWRGLRARANPLLWVLHVGYLWLVLGLALLGLSMLVPALPASAALHALTAGSIATMVVGVMSRAALGHSGRKLEAKPPVVAAYVLISAGAALRVAAPLAGDGVAVLTLAGGAAWSLAWLLFALVYLPIVTRPRADGRPG